MRVFVLVKKFETFDQKLARAALVFASRAPGQNVSGDLKRRNTVCATYVLGSRLIIIIITMMLKAIT